MMKFTYFLLFSSDGHEKLFYSRCKEAQKNLSFFGTSPIALSASRAPGLAQTIVTIGAQSLRKLLATLFKLSKANFGLFVSSKWSIG